MSDALAAFQAGEKIEFTRGDDFDVILTIKHGDGPGEIPIGQALLEAWWTVKSGSNILVPDAQAIIQKHVTTTLSPTGGIFVTTDADGTMFSTLKFVLSTADTLLFDAGGDAYYWDAPARSTAGKSGTLRRGYLNVIEQITQSG
jgi:hypothetical protein